MVRIGPASAGWVYRTRDNTACCRRLAVEQVPVQARHDLATSAGTAPPAGYARLSELWQAEDEPGVLYVRYEIPRLQTTLAEALDGGDPAPRARAVLAAARAAPSWIAANHAATLMPADVAITEAGNALLLAMPPVKPSAVRILDEPLRAVFLPPEAARGLPSQGAEDAVRYFLGALLQLTCQRLDSRDRAEDLLAAAAAGTVLTPRRLAPSLPFWQQRLDVSRSLLHFGQELVATELATRRRVDLADLGRTLQRWIDQSDPLPAARGLRRNGRVQEAFALLQDTMLTDDNYDVLVEAADLVGRSLGRPLEQIDLLERAIADRPGDHSAREGQLVAIMALRHGAAGALVAANVQMGAQLDERIRRDWDGLDGRTQLRLECDYADYLLWRGEFDAAADFSHPRLFAGTTYLWQKYELNLAYARALIGQGWLADAEQQLGLVASHVEAAYQRQEMSAADRVQRLSKIVELKAYLRWRRTQGDGGVG
jgi:hypothetical protein